MLMYEFHARLHLIDTADRLIMIISMLVTSTFQLLSAAIDYRVISIYSSLV